MNNKIHVLILTTIVLLSCSQVTEESKLNGKWEHSNDVAGFEIFFNDGSYSLTDWNDDVQQKSSGKYILYLKGKRQFTVLLIPDVQFLGQDTLILPCEGLNVINFDNSYMEIQEPSKWDNNNLIRNEKIILKKQ